MKSVRTIVPQDRRRPAHVSGMDRPMHGRVVPVLAVLALLTACSTSEDEARVELSITHYEHLGRSTAPVHLPAESLAVEGGVGSIQVTGTIRLPDHCDDLRADLVDRRPVLELRLRHQQSRGHQRGCDESDDRTVLVAYRAEIRELPPARYRLRMIDEGHSAHGWFLRRSRAPGAIERHLHDDTVLVR